MRFALIGNQNCGKTTLFNKLTGASAHVGNFPGVTVDSKEGEIRAHSDCTVVDLPGIYSLRPYSSEEIVTRDFLLKGKPDGIINIVDATNIERNLYLTLQILEMGIPTVLALNMMDEVRGNGGSIDVDGLSRALGVPAVPISAAKNEGVEELTDVAIDIAKKRIKPAKYDFCTGAVHRCVHSLCHMIEDHAREADIPVRFAASKLIEGDSDVTARLRLGENELETVEHIVSEMENDSALDRNEAMADMRYTFIENVCRGTVNHPRESKEHERSMRIDRVLTGKYTAIPIFIAIMAAVFFLTFQVIGLAGQRLMETGVDALTRAADGALDAYGINPVVHSLIIDGVFTGVGSVLSFLPIIVVLFFFLSLLEDSGYMARVAFVMDRPLRRIGLSGKSFVPMLIGFGCSVPAIMATRTISGERDRRMTVMLVPYMSCSAKIPIYTLFTAAFFAHGRLLVVAELYIIGMAVGILAALIMKKTAFRGNPVPFVMELPNYRIPSAKSVLLLMWEKAKDFLQKAFTVIFVASVIIWFLTAFDTRLNYVSDPQTSMLAGIGRALAPLFRPLGFARWEVATALITGLTAKEAVISTLSVLTGGAEMTALFAGRAEAFSFLIFTLLYTPCVAAFAAVRRELGSAVKAVGVAVMQCAVAWACAGVFYTVAGFIS